MTQPTYKRHYPVIYGQNNSGSHGSFGASGRKGIHNTKRSWGQPKDDGELEGGGVLAFSPIT